MAPRLLAVILLIILTAGNKESKPSTRSTSHHLCVCKDRTLQIQVNNKESPFVSCEQGCLANNNGEDTSWRNPLHLLRRRRELSPEKACYHLTSTDGRLIVKNLTVTFRDKVNGFSSYADGKANCSSQYPEKANCSSWYAEVQWDPLDYSEPWSGYCVSYVNQGPGDKVPSLFISKNKTSVNITPWWEKKEIYLAVVGLSMSNYNKGEDVSMVPYWPPVKSSGTPTTRFIPSTPGSNRTVSFVAMAIGILVGVLLVGSLLTYFLRRKKTDIPLPSDFEYHAFIIYSHEDRHWMKRELLPLLEGKHNLTCCLHYKDFIPGKTIIDNMTYCVYASYKVIALFSSNFVNSNFCEWELDVAVGRLVAERDNSLVVIRIDGTDYRKLPIQLKGRSFIDYHLLQERPFWRQRLFKFLCLPEECEVQSTSQEKGGDNNNDESSFGSKNVEYNRLESTISNASETSYL